MPVAFRPVDAAFASQDGLHHFLGLILPVVEKQ